MSENTRSAIPLARQEPVIRRIGRSDIVDALSAGLRDFQAYPAFGLFFGSVYALGGVAILACAFLWDLLYLVNPLAAGFVLIGPFVAVGLYEVSRLREQGSTRPCQACSGRSGPKGPRKSPGWPS